MSIASVQSDAITPFAARPGLVPRWESRVFTESGPSEQSYAIAKVLRDRDVTTLFQPIVRLTSGEIIGYEALTRPPADSPFTSPVELFAAAAHCGSGFGAGSPRSPLSVSSLSPRPVSWPRAGAGHQVESWFSCIKAYHAGINMSS